MSNISKRVMAVGVAAMAAGFVAFGALPTIASASSLSAASELRVAQADDPKGKSDINKARPANPTPGTPAPSNQAPAGGGQPPSPAVQNAPQSGVPARCAAVADATERQRCMNTPKGQ